MKKLPILYKYKAINENTKEMIKKNIIYLPNNDQLNDPFECKTEYYGKKNTILRIIYFYKISKEDQNDKKLIEHIRFALSAIKPDKEREMNAIKKVNDYYKESIEKAGIGAFTKQSDNILMWSHYANNHGGICMQFDFNKDPVFSEDPFWKVKYKRKYPKINLYGFGPERKYKKGLLTKAKIWKYENERRIVWKDGHGKQKINPETLTGIIFGCKIDKKEKSEIREILLKRNYDINIYQASIDVHNYKLNIVFEESIKNNK